MAMGNTPPRMRDRLRVNYAWTPRQRQVLHHLATGKTNAEIGEALGISRDGAKWHVSEILSRLGVDSREEAAEYWRRYSGLAPRFARVFRGVAALGSLRWIAASAAVVAAAGLAGAVIIGLRQGDNDPFQPLATQATATPAATTSAWPGQVVVRECGVEQAICDFAYRVERELQARDYAAVASTDRQLEPAVRDIARFLGADPPQLLGMGCPLRADGRSCDGSFVLVFSVPSRYADWTGTGRALALGYEGSFSAPSLTTVNALPARDGSELARALGTLRACDRTVGAAAQARPGCNGAFVVLGLNRWAFRDVRP